MKAIYVRFFQNALNLFWYLLVCSLLAFLALGKLEPALPAWQVTLMVAGVMLPMFLTGTAINLLLIYYGTQHPEMIIWAMETENGKKSLIVTLIVTFTVLYFIFSLLYRELIFVPVLAAYGL